MGIVSTYSKEYGNLIGLPGPAGKLRSTKQVKPYTLGIPFDTYRANDIHVGANRNNCKSVVYGRSDMNSPWDDDTAVASNMARARLMGKLTPARAAMAVNLATLDESLKMIALRSGQLAKAYRSLRQGNFRGFSKTLGIHPDKRVRTNSKNASATWLEYTFGWAPLLSDIYASCDVLATEFTDNRESSYSTVRSSFVDRQGSYTDFTHKVTKVRMTAGIRVTNPNTALANQLGLLNPAAVAWDIVPFSFVVDWFFGINKYVNTLNDMAGFEFVNPSTTIRTEVKNFREYSGSLKIYDCSAEARRFRRQAGITPPVFNLRLKLPMPSLWIAATSTSLAHQVFSKK